MQLWPVAHFFHFVITFRWVQQQSNSQATAKQQLSNSKPTEVMTEWKKVGNWSELHS